MERPPEEFFTVTLTVRLSSCFGPLLVRYVVAPVSDVPRLWYSYGVNRYAVETVWLHATSLFQPMFTTGEPIRLAPATS